MIFKKMPISISISTSAPGGISSVISGYRRDRVFEEWNTREFHSHKSGGFILKIFLFISALSRLVTYLFFNKVSFVHLHAAADVSFWRKGVLLYLVKLFKVPVVLHLHGGRFKKFYDNSGKVIKKLIEHQMETADAVIVLSETWSRYVLNINNGIKVYVLPNYVRVPMLLARYAQRKEFNISFLGFLSVNKGIYDLIPAYKKMLSKIKGGYLYLNIAGNGEVDKVRDLVGELQITDNVNVLGWLEGADAQDLLEKTDIFVLPSYHEGLPVALLEAMACGIPVITTPVGAISELIKDGQNGFIINPGDRINLLDKLIKLYVDEDLRKRIGMNARKTVIDSYSDQVILPKLNALYASLVDNKY